MRMLEQPYSDFCVNVSLSFFFLGPGEKGTWNEMCLYHFLQLLSESTIITK